MTAQGAFVSPPDLYTLLCSAAPVVVFDVRNKEDYDREKIWSSVHLNLQKYPSIIAIARELFAKRSIYATDADCPVTPYAHRRLFVNRALYHVVVVDEDGSDSRGIVAQLGDTAAHKPVQLLVGGYKMFNTLYPALCVGSSGQDNYLIEKCEKEYTTHTPVEVDPDVFFGDLAVAQNFKANDVRGIGSMVNVAAYADNFAPTAYKYLRCDQEELPLGDLIPLFNKVFKFIEAAKREGEKVLIYSIKDEDGLAGMFACAYLMRKNGWPLEKAFLHFKRLSPSFSPNVSLLSRLGEYEKDLVGSKHIEESITGGGERKERREVSEELKYVRRRQAHELEKEREEAAAQGEGDELEEDLC
eukprot:Phypoly_transcript_10146.p1 GENE.Phypoly_transcript_10146~~Phypoly_transcript_10146.p1  ORF type:complete len:357 (+),score=73.82 Phypoly_transcript_10146:156-1226(+)